MGSKREYLYNTETIKCFSPGVEVRYHSTGDLLVARCLILRPAKHVLKIRQLRLVQENLLGSRFVRGVFGFIERFILPEVEMQEKRQCQHNQQAESKKI